MQRIHFLHTAIFVASSILAGCAGDPIVGSWESEEATASGQRDTFTLEEDGDRLIGDGTWYSVLPGQACPVDIDVRLVDDTEYKGTITGNGACGGNSLTFDCDLVDGDERIDCGSDSYRRTD